MIITSTRQGTIKYNCDPSNKRTLLEMLSSILFGKQEPIVGSFVGVQSLNS